MMRSEICEMPVLVGDVFHYFMASLRDIDPFNDWLNLNDGIVSDDGSKEYTEIGGNRRCGELLGRAVGADLQPGDNLHLWPGSWNSWRLRAFDHHEPYPPLGPDTGTIKLTIDTIDIFGMPTEWNRRNCIAVMSRTADPR
jgi:hypothetical protein